MVLNSFGGFQVLVWEGCERSGMTSTCSRPGHSRALTREAAFGGAEQTPTIMRLASGRDAGKLGPAG